MDWSKDLPEVQSTPTSCVSPIGENMSSPCALLHKINTINMAQSIIRIINYIKNNLADKKPPTREFIHVTKSF